MLNFKYDQENHDEDSYDLSKLKNKNLIVILNPEDNNSLNK